MNNVVDSKTMMLLGLSNGDRFVLNHHDDESKNEYLNVIFTYNGRTIEPKVKLIQILVGKYIINKLAKDKGIK
jgi:hypothetical protein